jgi:membrane protein implicated in regulation of membrane protease activity
MDANKPLTVFWRYWLLQIPGWGVVIVALLAAHRYAGLSLFWAVVIFAAWLLKDWAIYPILRNHYRFRAEPASDRIVGRRATAREALRPAGYVDLGGELWLAEVVKGGGPVEAGEEVTVEAIDGLTLRVRLQPSDRRASG